MRTNGPPAPRLPRAAVAVDLLAALVLGAGLIVMLTGPLPHLYIGDLRFSMSSPRRALLVGLVLLLVRHWYVPRHPVLARLLTLYVNPRDSGQVDLFGARPGGPSGLRILALCAGFSALVVAATWPQIASLDAVPDLGDPLFSTWRIGWIAHQLVRDPRHLFDGNMFYPERLTLTYSDSVLVPGLMAAPFFWLGGHPIVIYNLLFLSGFVLSGVSTCILVRALTGRWDAALVSGAVFALYPYRYEHYSHLELQMTMFMPLTLLGLHRTLASGRLRDGAATGLAFAGQALSSIYYGLFLAAYMVPLGLVLWLGGQRRPGVIRALAVGALVAGMLVAPVGAQYLRNRGMLGERSDDAVQAYSATPADYLKPHFRSRLYEAWSHGGQPERQLFPGFVPVALAAAALWPPVSIARIGYALAFYVAWDGSLGYNGVTFAWLRQFVLPYRALRVPARFSILVGLTLAILAGYAAARLLSRWPRWRIPLTCALLAAVAYDSWPRLELEPVWRTPPAIYGTLDPERPAVVAEFPTPSSWENYYIDARYIYFSTFHWQRLLNGNSGFSPPSYDEFIAQAQGFPSDETLDYLRRRNVRYFTLHGAFYHPVRFANLVGRLDGRRDVRLVSVARWEGSESRLYELRTAQP